MRKMDLSISAAGSTVWELLYIGVPTILMIIADNQNDIANNLGKDGYVENLGWYNKVSDKKIIEKIKFLMNNNSFREELFKKGQALIDSKGKGRIVSNAACEKNG
jgi:spore coat polysaccharide biosynthesis predicted glycosyltransferase SpsG